MDKIKKILMVAGGALLILIGYLFGGGLPNRRRVQGTQRNIDDAGSAIDSGRAGIADAQEQLVDSEKRVDRLTDSVEQRSDLIGRGRAILERAKARNDSAGNS
jgi:hypothetical protein